MNISIASYAFHGLVKNGLMDVFGYLESCKYRYHLNNADIWNGMIPDTEAETVNRIKSALHERELTLVNLCVDGPHLWEDDPALREEHYRDAQKWLGAAETLGARTLRIDAGGREDTWTAEQFDYIVHRYQEYAQRAYDGGYQVGPENHWGAEAIPENMQRLCQAVNHPGFGVLLHFRGNPGDVLMAPWAMHTHISWKISQDCLEQSMDMLCGAGYTGCWGIEYHAGEYEYARVAVMVERVRSVLSLMRATVK